MLFMCVGTWRDLGEDDQLRMLEVFEHWKAPPGLEMRHRWITPAGKDFIVADVESAEVLAEGIANWAPFIDYEIFPLAEAESAFPGVKRAVENRRSMRSKA